jgi:hypothetical protein
MTNALPSLSPVLHDIHVNVVSAEEHRSAWRSSGQADRMIAFTRIEDSDLTLRIEPSPDGVVLGAHALAEALARANRLLAIH